MTLSFYAHYTMLLPEFSNTCSIIEHNLKSKQWIGLKFSKHVCNRLILNLRKFQLDSKYFESY